MEALRRARREQAAALPGGRYLPTVHPWVPVAVRSQFHGTDLRELQDHMCRQAAAATSRAAKPGRSELSARVPVPNHPAAPPEGGSAIAALGVPCPVPVCCVHQHLSCA